MNRRDRLGKAAGAIVLLLVAPLAVAQGQQRPTEITWETADNPGIILVDNADRLWTQGPQGILEGADMLVRDGQIAEIGSDLSAPDGALVIDASGMQVTPGLIDAHSHTGADAINEGTESVTAEVRIPDVLDAEDLTWYRQLAGGLTSAQVLHGSANSIGGQSAIVKLRYRAPRAQDLLIDGVTPTIKFALGENVKRRQDRYPNTRMGVEQTIRSAFLAAQDYRREWEEYNALTEGEQERRVPPRRDLQLETLVEILDGKRKVHSHSYRQDEILMLIRVADDFGFKIGAFQHVLEGYKVAQEIAAHGAGGSTFSDWWAYKIEAYDAIPYNGAIMHQYGVVVSFNSDSGDLARRLNLEAAKAIRYGNLEEEEALNFVTLNPAIQLGIDDRVGSLEPGKDADFVIWNGNPLSVYSRPEMTFVDGRKMFDRELDLQMRENIAAERERLITAVREAGSGGGRGASGGRGARGGEAATEEAGAETETAEESGVPGGFTNPAPVAHTYRPSELPDAGTFAIVGATVHTVSGPTIENGIVVFANGEISAVGDSNTSIPTGATRIDAAGQHVYPGLISANTILGLTEIGSVDEGNDPGEMGDINSNIRAEVAVNPDSELIPVARGNGVTYALTAPRGGLIAGTSAMMRLDGWTWENMTAAAPVTMHVRFPRFRSGGRGFGGRGGGGAGRQQEQIDLLDKTLDDARAYAKAKAAEADGAPEHETDSRLEALIPVVEGRLPLAVHTSDVRAVEEAVAWAARQGIRIVLYDSGDAWRVADLLAEHDVPVIVDNVLSMPSRSDEPYDLAYARPGLLHAAGVKFAIATGGSGGDGSNVRNLPFHAGVAAGYGLPREEALKAVTLYPAQILGLADDLGSIEVGKSASLVITDGDILEIRTHVLQEFIDGRPVDLSSKHTQLWERYRNRPVTTGRQR